MKDTTELALHIKAPHGVMAIYPPLLLRSWTEDDTLPFDEGEEVQLAFEITQELEEEALDRLRLARAHKERLQLHDLLATVGIVRRYYTLRLASYLDRCNRPKEGA